MKQHLHKTLVDLALQEGFALASGVDIESSAAEFQKHFDRYKSWIDDGNHASMAYLERGLERRGDLKKLLPDVQSVFCVALPYPVQIPGTEDSTKGVRYARYMWGGDYHDRMAGKLNHLMEQVSASRAAQGFPKLGYKICVDTSAVLERSWASFAGLGWIGKNTMLIHPKLGSFFFLGVVLLSEPLGEALKLLSNYCGNCSACLEGCPTQAFKQPGLLDARRCISSWTLETRGALELSEADRLSLGNRIGGCDICQEVCPFNQKVLKRGDLSPPEVDPALHKFTFLELEAETREEYQERVKNSALSRIKYEDFKRNLNWIKPRH